MPDPLVVAQVLCHEVIRDLIVRYEQLQRDKTMVSLRSRRRLRKIGARLRKAQSGFSRRVAQAVTKAVIEELVGELLRFVRETSIYLQSLGTRLARQERSRDVRSSYAPSRAGHPFLAARARILPAGVSEEGRNLFRPPFSLGERSARSDDFGPTSDRA